MDHDFIRSKIRSQQYDLSDHAHQERQEEQITVAEIEETLLEGVIIEQYLNDPRGKSCLVAGKVIDKPFHVICGFRNHRLLIVTVYRPKPPTWVNYKKRSKELKSRV